jgi:hypothetical protein
MLTILPKVIQRGDYQLYELARQYQVLTGTSTTTAGKQTQAAENTFSRGE